MDEMEDETINVQNDGTVGGWKRCSSVYTFCFFVGGADSLFAFDFFFALAPDALFFVVDEDAVAVGGSTSIESDEFAES